MTNDKPGWVDFRQVKQEAQFEPVLAHYGLTLRAKGAELVGRCPFHEEKKPSFRVNLEKKVFHCFGCGAKGNVLDFVSRMEQVSVRDAALKLQEWLGLDGGQTPATPANTTTKTKAPDVASEGHGGQAVKPARQSPQQAAPGATSSLPQDSPPALAAVNPPLQFTLKGIDPTYPYLDQRGIARGIAEYFGAGFFPGKGTMAGRVVIPIYNEQGDLVAYAGRSIDDSEPRYKVPAGFQKALVLFNLHRVLRIGDVATTRVIVVEGFFDCMKLVQAGFLNTVALMGNSLSEAQEALLKRFREINLMLDGDPPGRAASNELAARLAHASLVRIVDIEGQPDELSTDQIQAILGKL